MEFQLRFPPPPQPPDLEMFTDASLQGWGAQLGSNSVSGLWPEELRLKHINWLELEAVCLALKHFLSLVSGLHVRVHTDNTTVACYLNILGGTHSPSLSVKTEELLLWCQDVK